jgi:hypothetical protein
MRGGPDEANWGRDPIPQPLSWFGAGLILTALIAKRTESLSKKATPVLDSLPPDGLEKSMP